MHNWRNALTKAANLAGHDLHGTIYNGNESKCIEHIVKEIHDWLDRESTVSVTSIGAELQIKTVSSSLMKECKDVRFLGISGMGGIGKTTLASTLFHKFSYQFEGACFVNVKETQAKEGLLFLQKTLLTELLTIESLNLVDENHGIVMIKRKLRFKKVLVVLDDVDHQDQLDRLAGAHDWFGNGSRIIITARDEHLLLDCDDTYQVPLLVRASATQLFNLHAFKKPRPNYGFEELSHQVVRYAGGLPLALKVLGSFLRGRSMQQWISALDELQRIPRNEIISTLKISCDGLEDAIKQVFLDLACLFGISRAYFLKNLFGEIAIDVLVEKSLLFVSSSGFIGMHDLIREMGKQIAEQESSRRWIWLHEHLDILTENEGVEAIEGILIPPKSNSEEDTIHLSNDVFKQMKRLRIYISYSPNRSLQLCSHDPTNFRPNNLCLLEWSYYPSPSLPINFEPRDLVILHMPSSYLVKLWKGSKRLKWLTALDVSDSQNLIQVPDLSGSPYLETLILSRCIRLEEVHRSVGTLNKLRILNAEGCEKLERLPTMFQSGSLAILRFFGCQSLTKFPEIQPYFGRLERTSSLFDHIQSLLDLSVCSNIETLPNSICKLKNLKYIYLNRCFKLKNLPEDIGDLVNLEGIDASETSIWCIPNSISRLEKLKCLSFRKVPKFFNASETSISFIPKSITCLEILNLLCFPKLFQVSDLCSWGCFDQLDLNFHLPNVSSAFSTLTHLDLSACNLLVVPEDLNGCLTSLLVLNLSRNSFTHLPMIITLLHRLQLLDITYCEKLEELPELPPSIKILLADDRFALQSIPTLPTTYKELYLVSFANQKLQEMWCNSLQKSSNVQMRNCPGVNMTDMLEDILLPFLSIVQKKVFDSLDVIQGGRFGIVFPRCDPSVEVPSWFDYPFSTSPEGIWLKLDKQWYNDKFVGFAIYCQLPFLNGGGQKMTKWNSAFNPSWIIRIGTKLVPEPDIMNCCSLEMKIDIQVSNVVACASHDCFVFLQFDLEYSRKGKGTSMVNDPNVYSRFEASINWDISSNWGVRLVYANDIETVRLKSSFTGYSIA